MVQTAKPGKRPINRPILILGTGLFLLGFWPLTAAEITIPEIEMASRGKVEDKEFVLTSVISADLALSGGYKYSFLLGFSLDVNYIPDRPDNQAAFAFRIAKATAHDLFDLPLELSYFFGSDDNFCTGDEFLFRFGVSSFGTEFRGFFYFPEGIGGNLTRRYNGIYGVNGTGLSLALTKWDTVIPMLYIYQDFAGFWNVNGGIFPLEKMYSGDLRLLLHHNWLQLDTFGGITLKNTMDLSVRGGIMVHMAGNGSEFFAQGGIPGWNTGEKFKGDNIFFLIEPRLHFDSFSVIVTFFYHPWEYIHVVTDKERGKADLNIKFRFGKANSGLTWGIETGGTVKIDGFENFSSHISPFVSLISGGLKWDAKIRIKPQEYDIPMEMVELFIGVRTAF